MSDRLLALVCLALAAGCLSPLAETDHPSEGDPQKITFVEEYGFCLGRCYSELRVDADGQARVIVRERRGQTVLDDHTVTLSASETARLGALARDAASGDWEAIYGCPDCVDQGRFELALRAGDDVRATVLDPLEHPAAFDDLVDALRTVLHRERAPL